MDRRSRRQILKALGALTIGGVASSIVPMDGWSQDAQHGYGARLGAQTNAWAFASANLDSFLAVLNDIKRIGYAGFETGYLNLIRQFDSPKDARQSIAATGLVFTGLHIFLPPDKLDPLTKLPPASLYEKVAHGGFDLGAQRLIFSGAPAMTEDELKNKIKALDTAGQFAHSLGLQFSYHNHWWEFQSKVGEIEALYTQTNPARVSFLLDAGHAYRGGADVPAFLRRHSARIAALHLRDYKDGKQVPLGEGSFPLREVAATLRELHWNGWALNEEEREDGTKSGDAVIEPAFRALHGAFAG